MDVTRDRRIAELFKQVLSLDCTAREAYLADACGSDAALRTDVQRLLELDGDGAGFLAIAAPQCRDNRFAQVAHSPMPGHTVGHYRIVREIGTGGMGTVYEAEQEQPRRSVALKLMKSGIASPSALRRFEYEVQILGRLLHPGIAQIYEAGAHVVPSPPLADGLGDSPSLPYFAME